MEKGERVPAGAIRSGDERTHHYSYDRHHRLVSYRCTEGYGNVATVEKSSPLYGNCQPVPWSKHELVKV
ncbi:hypothetical protein SEENIN0B_01136 [Salmonella enterica subsp. enterica serovar Infantis str. SARB27]|uniref:RHS repeat protein n=1 Tax=Salmonella enterica subsp. enterica serovar Infantis str. SARB27 TaxID=596155 RepID=A0A6C8G5Q4_SALIN|nr:hypothetical protein SEENIN0B_01136 [Salmonella enterica subsp. enterica serovar Infantis str. SARB27]